MMVVMDIIAKLVKVDADGCTNSLLNTSLLQDATRDYSKFYSFLKSY